MASKQRSKHSSVISILLGLAFGIALYLIPEKTPRVAITLLLALGLCLFFSAIKSRWIENARGRVKKLVRGFTALACISLVVSCFGWYVWPRERQTVSKLPPTTTAPDREPILPLPPATASERDFPLTVTVFANNGEYQLGTVIAGIRWKPEFTELDAMIRNNTDTAYEDVNVVLRPDEDVATAAQLTKWPDVEIEEKNAM